MGIVNCLPGGGQRDDRLIRVNCNGTMLQLISPLERLSMVCVKFPLPKATCPSILHFSEPWRIDESDNIFTL